MAKTFFDINTLSIKRLRGRFMQIPRRYYRVGLIIIGSLFAVFLIAGSVAYAKREALLQSALTRGLNKAKRDYGLDVRIGGASFRGLSTVQFTNIRVVPENRDSLATITDLRIGVKIMPLLFGDLKLSEITLNRGKISLVKRDTLSNYDFLFRKKTDDNQQKSEIDLASIANRLINQMLYKIPDDMDVRDFEINFRDETDTLNFYTAEATIDGGDVASTIRVNGRESVWHVEGYVDPADQQLDLRLFADGKKVELPFIRKRFGLKLNFDTIRTEMRGVDRGRSTLRIDGHWQVRNLVFQHDRISDGDISVPEASMDAAMVIGEEYVSIDSSSVVRLGAVEANPFVKYTIAPHKIYELGLRTGQMNAQDVVNSFPRGMFESLEGMQVAGKLQYAMSLYLDSQKPDDVKFSSSLSEDGFKVLKWGRTNLQKINTTFVYTPYEYGKPMRDIVIGPANPDFTPLDQISPNLKNALLTAEDPSFFSHRGFVEEAFRKSIATNYKERAFARGGSTISMQLVKNVFLNRGKTLARKIEEVLIVWIIENERLTPKSRMFEVYLNLIEWGRNVYGIGEASRYYFGKHPSQLNIGEGIFLASIVPRPKSGIYRFQGDGSLRPFLRGYFRYIGNIMARRGLTPPDSSAYGFYSVRLREALRSGLPVMDSMTVDSILTVDPEFEGEVIDQLLNRNRTPDTIHIRDLSKQQPVVRDTVLSPADQRRERREQRRLERRQRNN